jgi:hypothetical protein
VRLSHGQPRPTGRPTGVDAAGRDRLADLPHRCADTLEPDTALDNHPPLIDYRYIDIR